MNEDTRDLIREVSEGPTSRWLLALGWCLVGGGIVAREMGPMPHRAGEIWLYLLIPISLAIAIGVMRRASWFGVVAIPGGGAILLFGGGVSIRAFHPQVLVWWLLVALALLGLWTLVVGLAGFAEKQRAA